MYSQTEIGIANDFLLLSVCVYTFLEIWPTLENPLANICENVHWVFWTRVFINT